MQCSTATSQHDSRDVAQFGWSHVQPAKLGRAFLVSEAAAHRVAHCVRLLADFLEHVVRVIALLDVFRAELDFADRVLANRAVDRADFKFVSLDRKSTRLNSS